MFCFQKPGAQLGFIDPNFDQARSAMPRWASHSSSTKDWRTVSKDVVPFFESASFFSNSSDGVVPYSHLEGAQSELIVDSGHNAQTNAEAIKEVDRILKVNLADRND